MDEIRAWPEEKKMAELDAMAKTIKSSWEFLDVVFLIEGISRATAQQVTRTRNASYAMQSQRVTDARSIKVTNGIDPESPNHDIFECAVKTAQDAYSGLVDAGVALEDARGILPMNVQCNLIAKYNLRAFTDLVKARESLRAQGEYNSMVKHMKLLVTEIWPWSTPFFVSENALAIDIIEQVAKRIGIQTGKGDGWELAKAADLLRKG